MRLVRRALIVIVATAMLPLLAASPAAGQVTKIRMHLGGYLCGN